MDPIKRRLAQEFLEGFAEPNLDKLAATLKEDFHFEGPFFSCSNAADYLSMLRKDPPDPSTFEIRSVFENENQLCILYRFRKQSVETEMAQVFTFEGKKIARTRLIFDGRAFSPKA